MAIADRIYVDPSALTKLYLHEKLSKELSVWRRKTGGPLPVTHHGRAEVVNAICIASFLGELDDSARAEALSRFSNDFTNGFLRQADLLWRSALNRAAELSQRFTPELGTRTLDVLHIACALELELPYFLSFDHRQQKLAAATGLKLIQV